MYSVISNNGRSYGIQTYLLDTEDDLTKIPVEKCSPGDKAFVIETSTSYIVNHNKEWKRIITNSGSGGDSELLNGFIFNGGEL